MLSCWDESGALCTDDMKETFSLSAWAKPRGVLVPRLCGLLNVNATADAADTFTTIIEPIPNEGSCEKIRGTHTQCKPLTAFGVRTVSGLEGESLNSVVHFTSNCNYTPYTRPQQGEFIFPRNRLIGQAGRGGTVVTERTRFKYTNCAPGSGCSLDPLPQSDKGMTAGFVFTDHEGLTPRDPEWVTIAQEPNIQGNAALVMELNHDTTCPPFGNKKPVGDYQECKRAGVAECIYDKDSILGGCTDRACVEKNLGVLENTLDRILTANSTARHTGARNIGIANLIEGTMEVGKCGEPNATCLRKLDLDCSNLARIATKVQPKSQIIYDTLLKAYQVCSRGQ
jgi:hypothetical protein